MPRNDSAIYPHKALKAQRRRRFTAPEKKPLLHEADEPGMALSPLADARGMPSSLMLHSCIAVDETVARAAKSADSTVATPGFMDRLWLVKELQQRLRNKVLENEILKEAMEVTRQSRDCCAHRHRR